MSASRQSRPPPRAYAGSGLLSAAASDPAPESRTLRCPPCLACLTRGRVRTAVFSDPSGLCAWSGSAARMCPRSSVWPLVCARRAHEIYDGPSPETPSRRCTSPPVRLCNEHHLRARPTPSASCILAVWAAMTACAPGEPWTYRRAARGRDVSLAPALAIQACARAQACADAAV